MRRTPRTTRTDTLFTYTTRFRSTDDGLAGVDLIGKRAIVTGTSAGLGVETARCQVAHGAHVVGTARDIAKAEQATAVVRAAAAAGGGSFELLEMDRSEEHTSELQSLMRISYAVFCLKKKNTNHHL